MHAIWLLSDRVESKGNYIASRQESLRDEGFPDGSFALLTITWEVAEALVQLVLLLPACRKLQLSVEVSMRQVDE